MPQGDLHFLVEERGTPLFVLDLAVVRAKLRDFAARAPRVRLFYSTKTNPHPAVLDTVRELGHSFDAATLGEINVLLGLGVPADRILFTHPVKTLREVEQARQLGVGGFVFDALGELEMLYEAAPGSELTLRIAPASNASLYDYRRRFGAARGEDDELLKRAWDLGFDRVGLSFHVGSQTVRPEPWIETIRYCIDLIEKHAAVDRGITTLNIGAGFPLDYAEGVQSERLIDTIYEQVVHLPESIEIRAEPGRVIAGPAVQLLTTVVRCLHRGDERWCFVDASAYSGLIERIESAGRLEYQIESLAPSVGDMQPTVVAGRTLDPDDLIASQALLGELAADDVLLVRDVGAYTFTFFTGYHHLPTPQIAVVDSEFSDRVMLGASQISGTGVFAARDFVAGEPIFDVTGQRQAQRTRTSIQVGRALHIEPNTFGAHLNHSCEPNATLEVEGRQTASIVALCGIRQGVEIVADYATFEDVPLAAGQVCSCGAGTCRGVINGYAQDSRLPRPPV